MVRVTIGTHLREWRMFRGLKQREVVAALQASEREGVPTTAASLSRLENGLQPYSQPIMEALAGLYGTTVGQLIDRNPFEAQ